MTWESESLYLTVYLELFFLLYRYDTGKSLLGGGFGDFFLLYRYDTGKSTWQCIWNFFFYFIDMTQESLYLTVYLELFFLLYRYDTGKSSLESVFGAFFFTL